MRGMDVFQGHKESSVPLAGGSVVLYMPALCLGFLYIKGLLSFPNRQDRASHL